MLRKICIISFLIISLSSYGQSELDIAHEAYLAGDYDVAYEKLLPLAETSNPEAQHALGFMYREGLGVEQDYAVALKWYRKSAKQEFAEAQHNLGVMYYHGLGVQQDYVQAYAWFQLAAEGGLEETTTTLMIMREKMNFKELKEAHKLVRELLENYGNKNNN